MSFHNKVIWITGASSGIGKALAQELSYQNALLIISARDKNSLEMVRELCKNPKNVWIIPLDLEKHSTFSEITQRAINVFGRIDILVNNGGISQRSLAIETQISVDKKIMEINYTGTVALTKTILPHFIDNQKGQIAVTTSIVGKFGFPYRSSYSATKQALHGFFESLRSENVSHGIKISMIIPGRVKTNISVNALDKEGNAYNEMDQGQNKGKSVTKTAKIIVSKLQIEKKEILVGGSEVVMVHVRRFFPRLYYYLSSRVKPL
jgi:dehydrogenase/reductase SDR family protein 7B